MGECGTCRRYLKVKQHSGVLDCFMAEYYLPNMIFFCRPQIFWLIENLLPLDGAVWPVNTTGYTDTPRVQHSPNFHAPFETSIQIHAELTWRLERCGRDGETLVSEVQQGLNSYSQLAPAAKGAINYISGVRRRRDPYRKWRYQQQQKSDNCRF